MAAANSGSVGRGKTFNETHTMRTETVETYWIKLYFSGPIEVAKQIIREDCFAKGLCVTVDPTTFIYTGGEEAGYVVGLINYPRFPTDIVEIFNRAESLAMKLLEGTFQKSCLMMGPNFTKWYSTEKNEL
jgi:ferredoxin